MFRTLQLLHPLHSLNQLLMLAAGCWALALLLIRRFRQGKFNPHVALRVFVGLLYVQVLLGLLLFGFLASLHIPSFHGHSGWRHMGVGVAAALFGTLALWQGCRATRTWLAPLSCAMTLVAVVIG